MGKCTHYFGSGNTAIGFVNYYESIFQNTKKAYFIVGGSNKYKTDILQKLVKKYADFYNIEIINSSIDKNDIAAIKIVELNITIVNEDLIYEKNIAINDAKIIKVDISGAVDNNVISNNSIYLEGLQKNILKNMNNACKKFANSLIYHEKIEGYYYKYMNFEKANKFTDELCEEIIKDKDKDKVATTYHRFLGAATSEGPIDFVPNLTEGLKKYYLKGRSGTGKSTIIKSIANKASRNGFDIEVYHCGFDPRSLDMVIIRELKVAIFDSTKPHEYFKTSVNDKVIDTYTEFCEKDVDKLFKIEIDTISEEAKRYKQEAVEHLKKVIEYKEKHDDVYESALNKKKADLIIRGNLFII
ncbi:hypothetical protein [uncultured Clostridium sp.]|uniref:hypothetical protein n=1 Tax=uncultured Clostridium sp. TaxID=59620 RepID=UPI0026157981|nr:hypothetical protein [uncultured Clostridium sp.]